MSRVEHAHPLIPLDVQREWRQRGYWGELTLAKIVESWVVRDPNRTAITGDYPLTYAQLWETARRVAGALREAGLEPGQYLLAVMPNSWQGIVTELAASIAGVAFVPRSAQITPVLAMNLIDQLDVRGVVLHAGLLERSEWRAALETMTSRLAGCPIMIQGDFAGASSYLSFDVAASQGALSDAVGFAPCQPCLVLSTGGTTGNPKSILHCSETLVFAATRFSASLGFTENEVHVGVAPYGHAGGSVFEMYMPLLHGAKILPIARWQAEPVARTIEKYGGTFFITMGTHVFDMLALKPEDKKRLRSMRLISSGAGPDSLFEQGERELGFEIVRVFGFSECPGHAVGRLDDPPDVRLRQDGIPFQGLEYRILDPTSGKS
ncbi:MAG: AMP-binding protein, partial [Acidimicrobiales bacterium]